MDDLLKQVRRLEIKTRRLVYSTFAGEYHSAFKGQGLEFDEVRLYQYGDDIRSIDWNVTARTGQTYVKQFREEREQTLFVLFDVSGSEDFGTESTNKRKIGTEIAAIMTFSALTNQDKVGMATFSEDIETYIRPGKGRNHVMSMVHTLMQGSAQMTRTSMAPALTFVNRILKRPSIVVVLSDFLADDYEKGLVELARKHEVIMVRLFHQHELRLTGEGTLPMLDLESGRLHWMRLGRVEVENQIHAHFERLDHELKNLAYLHSMDYIAVNTAQPYFPVLEEFFRSRNQRRRR